MDFIVSRGTTRYYYVRMIRALFLIFKPEASWDRITQSRRGLAFMLVFSLLPMMLLVAVAEGFALVKWGRPQVNLGNIKSFTAGEAVVTETAQMLLLLLVILLCAYSFKALGETFHGRHNYTETLTVVIYGFSPIFLLRLFDVIPAVNLWVPWVVGVALAVKTIYHGVPRVMKPDPSHALGLYFMCALLLTITSGAERFVTIGYLAGKFRPVGDVISHIAARLHL